MVVSSFCGHLGIVHGLADPANQDLVMVTKLQQTVKVPQYQPYRWISSVKFNNCPSFSWCHRPTLVPAPCHHNLIVWIWSQQGKLSSGGWGGYRGISDTMLLTGIFYHFRSFVSDLPLIHIFFCPSQTLRSPGRQQRNGVIVTHITTMLYFFPLHNTSKFLCSSCQSQSFTYECAI